MKMATEVCSRLVSLPCQKPFQITYPICAASQLTDSMGLIYGLGDLQRRDLQIALSMFSHRYYVQHVVKLHGAGQQLLIHQIQKPEGDGFRIFGTLIAGDNGRYLMHCVETDIPRQIQKNKEVMAAARASLCI